MRQERALTFENMDTNLSLISEVVVSFRSLTTQMVKIIIDKGGRGKGMEEEELYKTN